MNEVCRAVIRSGLFSPGDRVICAVSGGADSMALLWALWSLRQRLSITVRAAHFHHGLRQTADRDEAFVADFCAEHGISLLRGRADVRTLARRSGQSIEQAARAARYAFLEGLSCDKLATAHHAQDNAETVLLNLIRGTALRGLCGIPVQRGRIVRPLLSVEKQTILDYLRQESIGFVLDESNEADDALRNRIRHQLLPFFIRENPRSIAAIGEMTQLLRQDLRDLDALTCRAEADCLSDGALCVSRLRRLDRSVRMRVLRSCLCREKIARPTQEHVALLEKLVQSDRPSAQVNLPGGVQAMREYDRLIFCRNVPEKIEPFILRPGLNRLPGLCIECAPAVAQENSRCVFTVVPEGEITVRSRREGDCIRLSGGKKSVKRLMIDKKIPCRLRDLCPVFEDARGILAVYGLGADIERLGHAGAVTIRVVEEL